MREIILGLLVLSAIPALADQPALQWESSSQSRAAGENVMISESGDCVHGVGHKKDGGYDLLRNDGSTACKMAKIGLAIEKQFGPCTTQIKNYNYSETTDGLQSATYAGLTGNSGITVGADFPSNTGLIYAQSIDFRNGDKYVNHEPHDGLSCVCESVEVGKNSYNSRNALPGWIKFISTASNGNYFDRFAKINPLTADQCAEFFSDDKKEAIREIYGNYGLN